jgi:hypothetical protein
MTRIGKIIGVFLLIVFTLQVTDLACVGEELPSSAAGIQSSEQILSADINEVKRAFSPGGILDECQCPCHLSFTNTPSTEVSSVQIISASLFAAFDLSLKKITSDIFQPPKILI